MAKNTPTDEFSELDDAPVKAPAKRKSPVKSSGTKVALEFPEGTDPKLIESITASMGKMVKEQVAASQGISDGRQKYLEESKVRYRCRVNSLRPGWNHFEMIIADENDNPKPLRGKCGVIIEQGLTMFAIRSLQRTHDFRTEQGRSMTIDQIMSSDSTLVLDYKRVKQPHYSVEILGVVENPLPLSAKIGGGK